MLWPRLAAGFGILAMLGLAIWGVYLSTQPDAKLAAVDMSKEAIGPASKTTLADETTRAGVSNGKEAQPAENALRLAKSPAAPAESKNLATGGLKPIAADKLELAQSLESRPGSTTAPAANARQSEAEFLALQPVPQASPALPTPRLRLNEERSSAEEPAEAAAASTARGLAEANDLPQRRIYFDQRSADREDGGMMSNPDEGLKGLSLGVRNGAAVAKQDRSFQKPASPTPAALDADGVTLDFARQEGVRTNVDLFDDKRSQNSNAVQLALRNPSVPPPRSSLGGGYGGTRSSGAGYGGGGYGSRPGDDVSTSPAGGTVATAPAEQATAFRFTKDYSPDSNNLLFAGEQVVTGAATSLFGVPNGPAVATSNSPVRLSGGTNPSTSTTSTANESLPTFERFATTPAKGASPRKDNAPDFLQTFRFGYVGANVRLIAQDGSVYSGTMSEPSGETGQNKLDSVARRSSGQEQPALRERLATLAPAQPVPGNTWQFSLSGTNRDQQLVVIHGRLDPLPQVLAEPVSRFKKAGESLGRAAQTVAPPPPARFVGTVKVGDQTPVEFEAVPERGGGK